MSSVDRHIAIACETDAGLDSEVCPHFGRAPYFTFVRLSDDRPGEVLVQPNPAAQHHQPGEIPRFIKDHGADLIITGGMGRRALVLFERFGVEVAGGASGRAGDALLAWLDGTLSGAAPCHQSEAHHAAGHEHHHHHHHEP